MYYDAIYGLIGQNVTVFLYKENKDTALRGRLIEVGQDYLVITGKYENEKNYIPLNSVMNVMTLAN